MRKAWMASVVSLLFLLGGCVNFGAPKYSDDQTITTPYGDTMHITRVVHDFPDIEVSIGLQFGNPDCTITHDGESSNAFFYAGFTGWPIYEYEVDLLNEWAVLLASVDRPAKAYRFHWGIFYTEDGLKYTCVLKHEYEERLESDPVFGLIYTSLLTEEDTPSEESDEVSFSISRCRHVSSDEKSSASRQSPMPTFCIGI